MGQPWLNGGTENERRNLASGDIGLGSARARPLFRVYRRLREDLGRHP